MWTVSILLIFTCWNTTLYWWNDAPVTLWIHVGLIPHLSCLFLCLLTVSHLHRCSYAELNVLFVTSKLCSVVLVKSFHLGWPDWYIFWYRFLRSWAMLIKEWNTNLKLVCLCQIYGEYTQKPMLYRLSKTSAFCILRWLLTALMWRFVVVLWYLKSLWEVKSCYLELACLENLSCDSWYKIFFFSGERNDGTYTCSQFFKASSSASRDCSKNCSKGLFEESLFLLAWKVL